GIATNGIQLATLNSDQSATWAGAASWSGAVTFSSTSLHTGVATFTAAPVMNGGLTVAASGAAITGNSSVTGTLTASSPLAALNGFTVTTGTVTFPTASITGAALNISAPTVQTFTSGTAATYTPTAGFKRIRVRMCGGGGGGAAATTNPGTAGNATSFGGWTANGGAAGLVSNAIVNGGSGGTNGTGTLIVRIPGGQGQGSLTVINTGNGIGGIGGANPFGGAGTSGTVQAGGNGAANTGAGGGGGATTSANAGAGGGAGEYAEFWMT